MKHGLLCRLQFRLPIIISAGIVIPVEIGKVAARDIQPDAVSGLEQIAGRIDLNRELVDLPGLDQRGTFKGVPVARSDNPMT